jgi:hypothetical protein
MGSAAFLAGARLVASRRARVAFAFCLALAKRWALCLSELLISTSE